MWAVLSPSLFDGFLHNGKLVHSIQDSWLLEHWNQWLRNISDVNPLIEELEEFTNPYSNAYLGHYFESLLEYWFRASPNLELITHNEQIEEGGQTAGEIDFVLLDKLTDTHYHIETTVKFYLSSANSERWNSWIGPNANDDLEKKLVKVVDHQLPLVQRTYGRTIPELKSTLLIKGIFFQHFREPAPTIPDQASPHSLTARWCHLRELRESIDRELYWKKLDKHDWLGPAIFTPGTSGIIRAPEIIQELEVKMEKATLLVGMTKQNGLFIESYRLFVVDDDWPVKQPSLSPSSRS